MSEPDVRPCRAADAAAFIALFEELAAESPFLLFGRGERGMSPAAQAELFERQEAASYAHQCTYIALRDGVPVAFLTATRGQSPKNRHVAGLALGVRRSAQRRGIGSRLMQAAIAWAARHDISRLELTVIERNVAAAALYRKHGFEVEGVRRASIRQEGQLENELYMSRVVPPGDAAIRSDPPSV